MHSKRSSEHKSQQDSEQHADAGSASPVADYIRINANASIYIRADGLASGRARVWTAGRPLTKWRGPLRSD